MTRYIPTAVLLSTILAFSGGTFADIGQSAAAGRAAKYDKPTVYEYKFSNSNLDRLRELYHNQAPPQLIYDILDQAKVYGPQSKDRFIWTTYQNPNPRGQDWTWYITANPSYTKPEAVTEAVANGRANTLKDADGGLALIGWLYHPDILGRKFAPKLWDFEEDGRYIVTILDLRPEDVDALIWIKAKAYELLVSQYGVDFSKDKVRLYFHFPYAPETMTLHLHIRVNTEVHPMDGARSLSIDDVIKTLSEGKSIKQLILERQANTVGGTFHFSKEPELIHMLEELGEGSPVEVANPFRKSPTP